MNDSASPSGVNATAHQLSRIQRRVLGVLLEKAFTTPDSYPLTANATVTACNQKSNRDPVTNYEAHEVDETLLSLKDALLAIQVYSATGRTERWKHNLREAWGLDRSGLSVLAELFLRGPQSEGDLRARASRMHPMASLDDLRTILNQLAERGFVRRLSPEGRKRGVLWGHLFISEKERAELDAIAEREAAGGDEDESRSESSGSSSTGSSNPAGPSLRELVTELQAKVQALEARLAEVETKTAGL